MKGLSFNVTLSEEQMKEIATLTAQEVKASRDYYTKENENLHQELDILRGQLKHKDEIIIRQSSRLDRYIIGWDKLKEENKLLKEEIKAFKGDVDH